jgi:hypothetical protein
MARVGCGFWLHGRARTNANAACYHPCRHVRARPCVHAPALEKLTAWKKKRLHSTTLPVKAAQHSLTPMVTPAYYYILGNRGRPTLPSTLVFAGGPLTMRVARARRR